MSLVGSQLQLRPIRDTSPSGWGAHDAEADTINGEDAMTTPETNPPAESGAELTLDDAFPQSPWRESTLSLVRTHGRARPESRSRSQQKPASPWTMKCCSAAMRVICRLSSAPCVARPPIAAPAFVHITPLDRRAICGRRCTALQRPHHGKNIAIGSRKMNKTHQWRCSPRGNWGDLWQAAGG